MNTPGIIFSLGGLRLTQYGLCIALGLLAGYLLAQYQARAYGIRMRSLKRVYLSMLLGMAVGARLIYVAVNFSFYGQNISALFKLWEGGYSVMGAVLGAIAGLSVGAGRRGFKRALDVVMPALLATLAIWRLGELATWQGRGLMLGEGAPGFPLTVANSQGRRCLAVCIYETVAALAILGYALPYRHRRPAGDIGLMCLALLGLSQIPLESMRNDNFLALGFVKIDQLQAALLALGVTVVFLRGHIRAGRSRLSGFGALVVSLAMIGMCVAEEFKLDDSPYPMYNYAMLALYALVMAISAQFLRIGWRAAQPGSAQKRRDSNRRAPEWNNSTSRDPRLSHSYYPAGRDGRSMSYHERLVASERRNATESGVQHVAQRPASGDAQYGTWRNLANGTQSGAQRGATGAVRNSAQRGTASASQYGAQRDSTWASRYGAQRGSTGAAQYSAQRTASEDSHYGTWRNIPGNSQYSAQKPAYQTGKSSDEQSTRYSSGSRTYDARRR